MTAPVLRLRLLDLAAEGAGEAVHRSRQVVALKSGQLDQLLPLEENVRRLRAEPAGRLDGGGDRVLGQQPPARLERLRRIGESDGQGV